MSEHELIAKQQLEIEDYKVRLKANKQISKDLHNKFYAIGAPLNDNLLRFNREQLAWCFELHELTQQINYIK